MEKRISKSRLWFSCILQGLVSVFLLLGAINNLLKTEDAISNAKALGYAESTLLPLALFLMATTCLYLLPKTSILGAVILTAWFGGAVATHVIHGDGLAIFIMPILFAVLVWVALGLRNKNVMKIFSPNNL
jgi:hypothetical protein